MPAPEHDVLLPHLFNGSYGRHETFHMRTGWLRKGLRAVQEHGPQFFGQKDGTEVLGVGKNMVHAIRYWCQACGILASPGEGRHALEETSLAMAIVGVDTAPGADPYLEDPGTDWVLHYELVSNLRLAPTFFWAFNLSNTRELTKEVVQSAFAAISDRFPDAKPLALRSVGNDFTALLRTYGSDPTEAKGIKLDVLDSPFGHLGLLATSGERGVYRFRMGPKADLTAEHVAYAIVRMLQRREEYLEQPVPESGSISIPLDSLLWGVFSPGMIFKIDGETLVELLERICERRLLGKATIDVQAGIRQFILPAIGREAHIAVLRRYYEDAA